MPNDTAADWKIGITCPHVDDSGTLVCWDCDENRSSQGGGSPPTWENSGTIKRKLRILSSGGSFASSMLVGGQALAPEVHPPAEGLEACYPDPRNIEPGLEVLSGPQIIYKNWDTEFDQKAVVTPSRPLPPPTIFGLRRRIFWLVIVCLILALLVGAAVGAAVGVTRKNASNAALPESSTTEIGNQPSTTPTPSPQIATETVSLTLASDHIATTSHPIITSASVSSSQSGTSDSDSSFGVKSTSLSSSSSSSSNSPADESTKSVEKVTVTSVRTEQPSATDTPKSEAPPTTVTVTPASEPSSTAAPTPLHTGGSCLGTDGSTYTDPGSGSKWKIECDIAHQGKDIENYEAQSMEACVSMCANESGCVGAIWYSAGPQGTDLNYCWLKKSLNNNLKDTKDAQSVVRL
ncbi:hypothetical protein F4776DRAFT_470840 [Hypoxylon sp. NC0597]|nr:hypothetical protein F4776DRAFT_470840 [Hypoxylon sp. NC0597]